MVYFHNEKKIYAIDAFSITTGNTERNYIICLSRSGYQHVNDGPALEATITCLAPNKNADRSVMVGYGTKPGERSFDLYQLSNKLACHEFVIFSLTYYVELHPILIHFTRLFDSKFDPLIT